MTQIFSCINPDLQEKYAKRLKKVVLQLRSRTTKSAGMDQKKHQLWTVRLNEKLRLFFTEHAQVSGFFSTAENTVSPSYALEKK